MRSASSLLLLLLFGATGLLVACADRERNPDPDVTRDGDPLLESPWFTDVSDRTGLDFFQRPGEYEDPLALPAVMAGGAALLDFDGDGDLDIFLTNGGGHANRLYRRDRDGRYTDVSAESGIGDTGYGMGIAAGDIDNDGDVDLYLTHYGPDRLFQNQGDGSFVDVTLAAGVSTEGWSTSATFCDFDRDGYLDLYVTRYVRYLPAKRCTAKDGRPDFCGPTAFRAVADVLLHNRGDGTFRDISKPAGIAATEAAGLGVVCLDADDDGWQDVYVANDADPNQLWINQGGEGSPLTFRDDSLLLGAAYNLHGQPQAGMGVVADDLDGNGTPDLFVTHLLNEANTLYGNLGGGGGFQDVSGATGLGPSSMPFTGFGVVALDAELDGDLDLVIANGKVNVAAPVAGAAYPPPWDTLPEPMLFYANDGGGRFAPLDPPARAFDGRPEIGRAVASGDIDDDGDVDLLVANLMGPARLYRNDAPRRGHWLSVRALDPRLKRDALGARVTVIAGDRRWVRQVAASFGYLASHSPRLHFGLGDTEAVDRIEVRWPDGLEEVFPGEPAGRAIVLRRGSGEPAGG